MSWHLEEQICIFLAESVGQGRVGSFIFTENVTENDFSGKGWLWICTQVSLIRIIKQECLEGFFGAEKQQICLPHCTSKRTALCDLVNDQLMWPVFLMNLVHEIRSIKGCFRLRPCRLHKAANCTNSLQQQLHDKFNHSKRLDKAWIQKRQVDLSLHFDRACRIECQFSRASTNLWQTVQTDLNRDEDRGGCRRRAGELLKVIAWLRRVRQRPHERCTGAQRLPHQLLHMTTRGAAMQQGLLLNAFPS